MVTERQRNPWLILVVLCFGFFMILLDTTIVNIAIPSTIDGLKASLDQILWVLNAYILVYAVLLITAGRLGDFFGQRNPFAAGLVIFTAASAACGLAQDPDQLIAAFRTRRQPACRSARARPEPRRTCHRACRCRLLSCSHGFHMRCSSTPSWRR